MPNVTYVAVSNWVRAQCTLPFKLFTTQEKCSRLQKGYSPFQIVHNTRKTFTTLYNKIILILLLVSGMKCWGVGSACD